jgi:hypothetical protein
MFEVVHIFCNFFQTMTNAPRWSRDLTKLMNPSDEHDWRLLAQRLGYSNDDIRAWASQHDPCMAVLSEWYATHKTREATYAVLTALQEMNRMDGAAIVENAMKTSGKMITYLIKLYIYCKQFLCHHCIMMNVQDQD